MFGGLLFSSGIPLCKTKTVPDNKYKKQFEQQFGRRTIRFHNVPEKIAKEPCSVLQQENNDVVDAVKKEYQDLPQYQPVSGLVGNIVGLHGQTCAVSICRPEVIDRGASPIHSTRNENSSDYESSSRKDKGPEIDTEENKKLSITLNETYSIGQNNDTQRIPSASSGIGTNSPDCFEIDSLEEFPLSDNGSQIFDEAAMPELTGSGFPVESTRPVFVPRIDRGVYSGGRLSVLHLESAPSCLCVKGCNCSVHGTKADKMEALDEETRISKERLTWGAIAQNTRNLAPRNFNESDADKTRSDILRLGTPSADVSGSLTARNVQERNQSPLQRADLEKWLNDVEESHKVSGEPYNQTLLDHERQKGCKDCSFTREKQPISRHRRMRAPLQESLKLLKRLQFVAEDDLQLAQNKSSPVHRGGRASCMNTVRAPSSLCLCEGKCKAHSLVETTSDQSLALADPFEDNTDESTDILRSEHQFPSTRTERIGKGGRQSTLYHVRASSGMCINGPLCQFHCQKIANAESITKAEQQSGRRENARKCQELYPQEITSETKELRGASSFGEVKDSPKYNTLQDQRISHCTLGESGFQREEYGQNNLRGASSFGDSRSTLTQQTADKDMRGASSFALEPRENLSTYHSLIKDANDTQPTFDETRGASGLAPLDESIAGTSSVTLSIAVESDGESFLADKSFDRKRNDSTLNLRTWVDKPSDEMQRVIKTGGKQDPPKHTLKSASNQKDKIFLDVNNNPSATDTEKSFEQRQKSKSFDGRILKVGKDASMMCILLNALRREGEQKPKKETSDPRISQRHNRENIANGSETLVRSLKFSVFYKGTDFVTPLLYVSVLGLEGVSDEIITPLHRAYVKVCLFPKFTTWRRTKMLNVSQKQLVFKDHFIISGVKPADLEDAMLRFVVVCVGEEEKVIGQLEVSLAELRSRDKLKRTCALHAPSAKNVRTSG